MKFEKEKQTDLLTGQGMWVYHEVTTKTSSNPFQIRVTAQGLWFKGESPFITNVVGLQEFAKSLTDAQKELKRLKPNLGLSATGH